MQMTLTTLPTLQVQAMVAVQGGMTVTMVVGMHEETFMATVAMGQAEEEEEKEEEEDSCEFDDGNFQGEEGGRVLPPRAPSQRQAARQSRERNQQIAEQEAKVDRRGVARVTEVRQPSKSPAAKKVGVEELDFKGEEKEEEEEESRCCMVVQPI